MANSKVQLADGSVLIDLTSDTVTAAALLQGFTAHNAAGIAIDGTLVISNKLKCERGSFTLETDWVWKSSNTYKAIPHTLGVTPELVILWPTLTDSTGPNRGYIYMAKPMGEARQRLSSSVFNTTSTQANYTVYSFDDPLTVSIGSPGSQSYVNKLPDDTNIYLGRFASASTWKAGTYNYFIAEGWIQEE